MKRASGGTGWGRPVTADHSTDSTGVAGRSVPEGRSVVHSIPGHGNDLAGTLSGARRFRGEMRPVLWEHVAGATQDGFVNVGYTDNYLRAGCIHPRPLTGTITAAVLGDYNTGRAQVDVAPMLEPL